MLTLHRAADMTKPRIVTEHFAVPIANHNFWTASREDRDESAPYGYGATEEEAIADLLSNEEANT